MKRLLLLVASALLPGAAAPADTQTKADIRCFIAFSLLGEEKDPNLREASTLGTIYYLGRLDGRTPRLDLEASVAAEASGMKKSDYASLLTSCGRFVEQRGKQLEAVGAALTRRGTAKP